MHHLYDLYEAFRGFWHLKRSKDISEALLIDNLVGWARRIALKADLKGRLEPDGHCAYFVTCGGLQYWLAFNLLDEYGVEDDCVRVFKLLRSGPRTLSGGLAANEHVNEGVRGSGAKRIIKCRVRLPPGDRISLRRFEEVIWVDVHGTLVCDA